MVFHHYLWPHVPQPTSQNDLLARVAKPEIYRLRLLVAVRSPKTFGPIVMLLVGFRVPSQWLDGFSVRPKTSCC